MFKLIGKLYFYHTLLPYILKLLKPVIIDVLLKQGKDYVRPETRRNLQRQMDEHNRRFDRQK